LINIQLTVEIEYTLNLNIMHTQIWNKYLPIIRILLKKTRTSDQLLTMNRTDFERAGVARKSGYKFEIHFIKGRVDNLLGTSQLAKDLAAVLLEDEVIKDLFTQNNFMVSMNTKFQLSIKLLEKSTSDAEVVVSDEAVLQ
jgi:hypothetical protein